MLKQINEQIDEQINDANELVLKWDLGEVQRNEKLDTLMKWETQLEREEFQTILRICNVFNYYSEKLTAQIFKIIFEENFSSLFIEHSKFMPLRRKDRVESAVDMFLSFTRINKIDVNRTNLNGPADFLKKYKARKEYLSKMVKENDIEDSKDNAKILNLQNEIKDQSKNQRLQSKIQKQISKVQARKDKRQLRSKELVEEYHLNYYSVKNMIIIDDFIGTGTSVVKLLKEINRIIGNSEISINIIFCVIEASETGIKEIEEVAKKLGIQIQIKFYEKSTDVLAENIVFSSDNINGVKEMIKNINRKNRLKVSTYCKNHAIASFVNAPNNNLTLLSEESSSWTALFLRTKRKVDNREVSSDELKDTMQSLRQ
ncbi:hypothetical protein [Neobacillus sp. 114]|uniref:phosphoribosyltransferase-like protein n=1 Tax=Neobacillus sp. 114 TaxID=3048535 RepID=UPI0024C237CF|nr:hypothetical protein [Neobacillus sp. 114]